MDNVEIKNNMGIKGSILFSKNKTISSLEIKKNNFLKSIKGNKNKYKRFPCSPIRYAGGKSLAIGYIVENIPNNIDRIVSPFFGGGSVEIACATKIGISVLGYDIFDILVNYWNIQIKRSKELYDKLIAIEPTKKNYNKIKETLKKHWNRECVIYDELELAALYYFNHNNSYGPSFLGWASSIYMNKQKYIKSLEKVKKFNGNKINVKCKSFEYVFRENPKEFLYCDPPYYLGCDSKMFKGIYPQRNFPIHHNGFNHQKLRDLLISHKGGFILSYNDCSTIRNWYKDFEIIDVSWQYTMGQGEKRIGKNRLEKRIDHIKKSHEILIIKR